MADEGGDVSSIVLLGKAGFAGATCERLPKSRDMMRGRMRTRLLAESKLRSEAFKTAQEEA